MFINALMYEGPACLRLSRTASSPLTGAAASVCSQPDGASGGCRACGARSDNAKWCVTLT